MMELVGGSEYDILYTSDSDSVDEDNFKLHNCVQNMQNLQVEYYSGAIPAHSEWYNNLNQSNPQKQENKRTMQHYRDVYEVFSDLDSSSSFTSIDIYPARGILHTSTQLLRRAYQQLHCKGRYAFLKKTGTPAKAEWKSNVDSFETSLRGILCINEPIEWSHLQVPKFIQNCIEHIERYGLISVGIFRVGTSKKQMEQLRKEFDRGDRNSIDPDTNPHIVAALLKKFLRDLPEPLLCEHLYKDFVRSQEMCNRNQQMEVFCHLVRLLPTAHRDTLYVLLRFLAKVALCADDLIGPDGSIHVIGNKMDSKNLATVFAPNILRPSLTNNSYSKYDELDNMLDVIDVIRLMIDHYERLFTVPAELIQDIYAEISHKFPNQLNDLCEHRYACDNEQLDESRASNETLVPQKQPTHKDENTSIDDPYQIGPTASASRQYLDVAAPRFVIDPFVYPHKDQLDNLYPKIATSTSDSENESEPEPEAEHLTSSLDPSHVIPGGVHKNLQVIPHITITDEHGRVYEGQDLILSEFGYEDHEN